MKIATIIGARPQFVKAGPVSAALKREGLDEILIHTGQHFDREMSDVFFADLGLRPPKHHLGIHGGTHGEMTGRMLGEIEHVLLAEKPDLVLVYGDTNSTMAGALAAAKLHIPVAHVEAGLRSFNRRMPEEINRVVTDHVSALLFCPTRTAVDQLAREGITSGVHHVGDVMYDAVLLYRVAAARSDVLPRLRLTSGKYTVATIHRAENTDSSERLAAFLNLLRKEPAQPVIFPLHPRTRQAAARFGLDFDGLLAIEPLGYLNMLALVDHCAAVYTDSGGLQKEAYFLGKPCVTLREETEWTETISHGWNRLWTQPYSAARRPIDDFGDGHAADAMARILVEFQRAEGLS
jgi:UDP-GlcNAc3NAcA epimerase